MHPHEYKNLVEGSTPHKIERLLKIHEVMAHLGVSRSTVYNLLSTGRLPAHKVLGSCRVKASALQRFIENLPPSGGPTPRGS